MQLPSRLRDSTLGDLLAQLHRACASGVLELIDVRGRHAIHLRRGLVQAVESESSALRLGDVAARLWGLSRPLIERARMMAQFRGIKLGQALVAAQLLTPNELDELLAEQQRARLEMLYALRDAEVRFRVARPLPTGAAEQSPLGPRDAFHGRPRKSLRDTTAPATKVRAPRVREHPLAREFSVLGVDPASDAKAVRDAFRGLVLALHPDRAHGATDLERDRRAQKLIDVVRAYRVITAA